MPRQASTSSKKRNAAPAVASPPAKRPTNATPKAAASPAQTRKFPAPQLSDAPVYVVMSTRGYASDGFHSQQEREEGIGGAYTSENQAYAAAIRSQIAEMEGIGGGDQTEELRKVVTEKKGLSMEARYKLMRRWLARSDFFVDSEEIYYTVKKCKFYPSADKNTTNKELEANLLEGLSDLRPGSDVGSDVGSESLSDFESERLY